MAISMILLPQTSERGFGMNARLGTYLTRETLAINGMSITARGNEGQGVRFGIPVIKNRPGQDIMPLALDGLENGRTIGPPPKKDIYSPTYLRGNRDIGQEL